MSNEPKAATPPAEGLPDAAPSLRPLPQEGGIDLDAILDSITEAAQSAADNEGVGYAVVQAVEAAAHTARLRSQESPATPYVHVSLESGAKPETVAALGAAIAGAIQVAQDRQAATPVTPGLREAARYLDAALTDEPRHLLDTPETKEFFADKEKLEEGFTRWCTRKARAALSSLGAAPRARTGDRKAAVNAVKNLERWFQHFRPGLAEGAWCEEMRADVATLKALIEAGALPAPQGEATDCYGRPLSIQKAEGCKCFASGPILMTGECPVHGEAGALPATQGELCEEALELVRAQVEGKEEGPVGGAGNCSDFDLEANVGDAARREYLNNGPDNWVSVGRAAIAEYRRIAFCRGEATPGAVEAAYREGFAQGWAEVGLMDGYAATEDRAWEKSEALAAAPVSREPAGQGDPIGDPLHWMLEAAEARNTDPKAKTVNLKFSRATLEMWMERARSNPPASPSREGGDA